MDSAGKRVFDFIGSLSDPRKDHFGRVGPGLEHAIQFAARDNVEARASPRQQPEDGQR